MKTKIITTTVFLFTVLLSSCSPSVKKDMSDAKENLKEENTDLKKATADAKAKTIADWEKFKNESDSIIISSEKKLQKLEVKISKAKKNEKKKLSAESNRIKKELSELKYKINQRDVEFKKEVGAFDEKVSEKNQSFMRKFNHDMHELEVALKDLFKDNVNK